MFIRNEKYAFCVFHSALNSFLNDTYYFHHFDRWDLCEMALPGFLALC